MHLTVTQKTILETAVQCGHYATLDNLPDYPVCLSLVEVGYLQPGKTSRIQGHYTFRPTYYGIERIYARERGEN